MSDTELNTGRASTELYQIMRQDLSFEEKATRAIELGKTYLRVDNGHLTKIDERIDFWKAIISTDPQDGDFPPGQILDLQSTYCRRVLEAGSTIALNDAPNQGWAADGAFDEHGLHCYHGTPLSIDGNVFGTLCFVSHAPRDAPFSETETLFAELIARLLEHELQHTRHETKLKLKTNLIGVLSRVLRHNLRNDLNVIRGHLTLMAERSDEPLMKNEAAVAKLDKLVDLSETARQIESIASSDLDRQPVELNSLVENVIDRVQANHPAATFTVESTDELYLEAIPSLRMALEELIENAAKHSGATPEVTISLGESGDNIELNVIDNGPGLPEQERAVLRKGIESPLIHGSGLGLWLTYWIVANHEGWISTDVRDEGTIVTVTLPKVSFHSEFTDTETLLGQFHREQDKFEAIFEESFDAILIFDDAGRFTDVNESAAELFGLSRKELRGRSYTEFMAEDFDIEARWTRFAEATAERDTMTLVRADGTKRNVEYSAVTDIIPGHHLAILRDCTARIEQEAKLQQTSQRLQAAIKASPDPIIAVDEESHIQLWNEAAEAVFGYAADEVLGEPISALNLHADDDVDRFHERFQRTLEGERFEDLDVIRYTKDGDEIHLRISTAPLRDNEGTITGVMAVAQDVTELLERERRYDALSGAFPDLCFILDEDGVYRDMLFSPASESWLYGEPDELMGQSMVDVLPPAVAERIMETIRTTIETGDLHVSEYPLELPSGTRRFEARIYPLQQTVDSKRLVSMVTRDVTDLVANRETARAI